MSNPQCEDKIANNAFIESFSTIKDERKSTRRNFMYPLHEILFLSISAVLCGIESYAGMEVFGEAKIDWLRKFFKYEKGIPSHDVINCIFRNIDSDEFSKCFMNWIDSIVTLVYSEIITIDAMGCQKRIAKKIIDSKAN